MTPENLFLFLNRFFQQLPSLDLSTLMGFLSSHTALQTPQHQLVHCFKNYRNKSFVMCGMLGPEVPDTAKNIAPKP